VVTTRRKCIICDTRPAASGGYCRNCHQQIEAERHRSREARQPEPQRYITYQGKVIGMVDLGGGLGKYQSSRKPAEKLPRARTIDLNLFCPGFAHEEIKRLKRLVLSLTQSTDMIGVTVEKSKKGVTASGN
jgi:hypothetical protein